MNTKAIALFGGSFDPPHNGHVLTITHLLNSEIVDEVWVIPSGDGRYDKKSVAKGEDRLALLQLLHEQVFDNNPRIRVLDIQLQRQFENSYAIELIDYFRAEGEKRPFFFVVGTDNVSTLSSWKDFERLQNEVTFLVIPRLGEELSVELPPYVRRLTDTRLASFSLSSTDLRDKLKAGLHVAGYLPSAICKELSARKLYQR
ncbi:MAG: nicotinate (nicotinamide) nucleotide adenylyltransferase [Bdellovibrionales bacterium]|nr:nicotinate (nicotinamide) nucleotide adenylyltransferase [Bdellovibrionales bacterium]